MRAIVRRTALLATPALLAALTGCGGAAGTHAAISTAPVTAPVTGPPTAPVIVPGRPGEEARTLGPGESVTPVPSPTANAADIRFAQDMVVHHRQAIEMALLAPSRASSDALKRLASRIVVVQRLEIDTMTRWLQAQGRQVPDDHADHHGMPGMATPERLARLREATGADFDRLFVELMIEHHLGALTMANQVLATGSHSTIRRIAADVAAEQSAEINRLRKLL